MLLFTSQIDDKEDLAFLLEIHAKYNGLVYRTAVKYLSSAREIEDLMQDCWEKLVKHVKTLRGLNEKALAAYIACTVRNTAFNYKSYQSVREQHASRIEVDEVALNESDPSPEEMVLLSERLEHFHAAFSKLPERDQQLLEGKYILDMDDTALAEAFHCKPESIRMKLTRARRRALKLLQEGESSDGQK
ncbi:MAG: sigma-70 family RNA polymerase sigma factor [Oscillospiraceae bacterium]|nr:sigma-70 family RNA polymerase sigma factor [Oscillospiraceae bacterium]